MSGGLREDLRSDLKIARPTSLKQAFSLAKMYEVDCVGTGAAAHTILVNRPNYRPNLTEPFQIDTDACELGVGAILSQEGHPLAYYSKKLSGVRQKASTYTRELWAVTDAVQKWRHYLLGHQFEIRIEHIQESQESAITIHLDTRAAILPQPAAGLQFHHHL